MIYILNLDTSSGPTYQLSACPEVGMMTIIVSLILVGKPDFPTFILGISSINLQTNMNNYANGWSRK